MGTMNFVAELLLLLFYMGKTKKNYGKNSLSPKGVTRAISKVKY